MSDDYTRMSGPARRRLLDAVIARDGRLCCICGLPITPGQESLQHKTPRSRGGATSLADPDSLGPAHRRCNYSLGNRVTEGPAGVIHNGLAWFTRPASDAMDHDPRPVTRQ